MARRLGPPTFLDSSRRSARLVARPVQQFLHTEASGGILLLAATVVALVWANSPWSASYSTFVHTEIAVQVGSWDATEDLTHWVNDGLMALFFFVVGLEIKRELVTGELRDRRAAVLPAVAAVGGMVVPALVYVAINAGGPGAEGWGAPMATDIAFALGLVAVLGSRVPASLKTFLLTLAIVDDIGAITVIALFYSEVIKPAWLLAAVVVVVLVVSARRLHVVHHIVYVLLGFSLWFCVFESGVHATIAGVVMGLLTPAHPFTPDVETEAIVDTLEEHPGVTARQAQDLSFHMRTAVPLTDRLELLLHPWTSYVVIPLFALVNAGIDLSGDTVAPSAVSVGVVAGLVVGKLVGITGASLLAVRTGLGRLPSGAAPSQLVGVAALAGIGFTVSLFVSGLAFEDRPILLGEAKFGVLVASVLAALVGSAILAVAARRQT